MRKIKCEECSTIHQGFHLCLGRKPSEIKSEGETKFSAPSVKVSKSEEQMIAFKEAKRRRWEAYHEANAKRDREILKRYQEGESFFRLGQAYGISYQTARAVVARLGGEIRPPGYNNRWKKENANG